MDSWATRSSVRSYRSLVCLLCTTRFGCALHCAHFVHSRAHGKEVFLQCNERVNLIQIQPTLTKVNDRRKSLSRPWGRTMVLNNQEFRRKYWVSRSSDCSFVHSPALLTHSIASYCLLHSNASLRCTHSLTCSPTPEPVGK